MQLRDARTDTAAEPLEIARRVADDIRLIDVARAWDVRPLEAGETLWFADDEADELALVTEGRLAVVVDRHVVGHIEVGELVGEASALLPVAARTASVRAVGPSRVRIASRRHIQGLRDAEDPTYDTLLDVALSALAERVRAASARLARLAEGLEPRPEVRTPPPAPAPSPIERKLSLHAARLALRTLPVLADTDDDMLTALAGKLRSRTLTEGETLCVQGERGDSVFLVGDGALAVKLNVGSQRAVNAARLDQGAMVGSLALLLGTERSATVVAETDCWVLEMDRASHDALDEELGRLWREMLIHALRDHITSANANLRQLEARRAALLERVVDVDDALASLGSTVAWPISEPSRMEAVKAQARAILQALAPHRRLLPHSGDCAHTPCPDCFALHQPKVEQAIALGQPIHFILPAFPAKSPNAEIKVLGTDPDMAEEVALVYLQTVCDDIRAVYTPGARVTICSDGRVFSDLVLVGDRAITDYGHAIERMIADLGLRDIDTFNLEDLFTVTDFDGMRDHLAVHYGEPLDLLRIKCKEGHHKSMLNGIHRFLFEDTLAVEPHKSRTKIRKECRERAYGVILRSNAFSRLIAECFPSSLRLSIHPQTPHAAKIGILLGHADGCWITPWHGAAMRTEEGWTLVKRAQAEEAGARLVMRDGKPSHFVMPGVEDPTDSAAPAEPAVAPPAADDWRRVYDLWFGADGVEDSQAWVDGLLPVWFFGDARADEAIRRDFAPWLDSMTPEVIDAWKQTPRGFLSLVLLFDQIPRNAFRRTPGMFTRDDIGLALAREAIHKGVDRALSPIEAFWLFLPFQHHPAPDTQRISVEGVAEQAARCAEGHRRFFGIAVDMAERHDDAIRRFGRFPHRNAILGRPSTDLELQFLEDPKSHF